MTQRYKQQASSVVHVQKSIALVGLSGTGKSTIGRILSEQLDWPLRDTDALIVAATGRTAARLFADEGEAHFRECEAVALRAALNGEPCVVATGAGIVLREENRRLLRQCFVVWLDAPTDVIIARLSAHDEERPLLWGNAVAKLDALRAARATLYAEVADVRVEAAGRTVEHIGNEIMHLLQSKSFTK